MFIVNSFVLSQFIETVLISIVNSHNSEISSSANYRLIALKSIISKWFEHFNLLKIKALLNTKEKQFSFKQSHTRLQINVLSYLNKQFALMSVIILLYLQSS